MWHIVCCMLRPTISMPSGHGDVEHQTELVDRQAIVGSSSAAVTLNAAALRSCNSVYRSMYPPIRQHAAGSADVILLPHATACPALSSQHSCHEPRALAHDADCQPPA